MDESSPILISEENGKLRIAWDNPRVRQGRSIFEGLLIPWIICVPVTLLLTAVIFIPEDLRFIWVLFVVPFILCWLFTIVTPYAWITKTWSESVEISKDSFSHRKNGFLAWKPWSSKTFRLDSIIELAFGSYSGFGSNSDSLNVIRQGPLPGSRWKHAFGIWLPPKLRIQVLKTIWQFVRKNQIPLKITRYGLPLRKTTRRLHTVVRSKPTAIDKTVPIEVMEEDGKLRLRWDNKRIGRNEDSIALALVLVFWTSVTSLVTYAIFRPNDETNTGARVFYAVWSVFGWSFALFLANLLAQRLCTEWIEVSEEILSHRRGGLFFRQPKTLALDSVEEVGISQSCSRREYSCRLRISFEGPSGGRLRSIGYWMEPEARQQVFQIIEDFVARKQIPLRMARYGP